MLVLALVLALLGQFSSLVMMALVGEFALWRELASHRWAIAYTLVAASLLLLVVREVLMTRAFREGMLRIRMDSLEYWSGDHCLWYGNWDSIRLNRGLPLNRFSLSVSGLPTLRVYTRFMTAILLQAASDQFHSTARGRFSRLNEFGPLSSVLDASHRVYARRNVDARRSAARGWASILGVLVCSAIFIVWVAMEFERLGGLSTQVIALLLGMLGFVGTAVLSGMIGLIPRDQKLRNHQLVLSQGEWSLHGDGEVIPLGREMQIKGAQVIFQRTDTGEKVVLFGKAWMPVQDSAE